MLQELAEQLLISFHNKAKQLIDLQNRSNGITHAQTIEISLSDSPPNLQSVSFVGDR